MVVVNVFRYSCSYIYVCVSSGHLSACSFSYKLILFVHITRITCGSSDSSGRRPQVYMCTCVYECKCGVVVSCLFLCLKNDNRGEEVQWMTECASVEQEGRRYWRQHSVVDMNGRDESFCLALNAWLYINPCMWQHPTRTN